MIGAQDGESERVCPAVADQIGNRKQGIGNSERGIGSRQQGENRGAAYSRGRKGSRCGLFT
jgi:hypothetical protein